MVLLTMAIYQPYSSKGYFNSTRGIRASNFQNDKETFVFVDQVFADKHQVTSTTQTTVQLKKKALETGSHTITAVQYENNDPKGKVISFNQATFETKPASLI